MKTQSSILMAALTLTAIILGVVLLVSPQKSARADMINAKATYTLMTTSSNPGGEEFLVILDNTKQEMVVYRMQSGGLQVAGGGPFGGLFTPPPTPTPAPAR